ncbi:MAG: transporter substrate-binding domain-containing protein [Planctomycetaceae bacterium]
MIGRGTARWRCGCWAAIVVAGGAVRADEPPPARTPVRVGVAPLASIVEWDGESPTGPMPEIWERLARTLDLESTFVRMPTVIAAIDRVERGGLDVVLGPVAITEERERSLDLTHPIFHSGMRITIRQKSDTGLLGAAR